MAKAYIGMGGNVPSLAGRPEATLTAALDRLGRLGRVMRRSSLYSTDPVGFADQPRFVNAVVELETKLEPRLLLDGLLRIEHEFGRDRSTGIPNGPRTLDLDILLCGDAALSEAGLEIPHPRLAERVFALVPLCEIDPSIVHARLGQTVQELLQTLNQGSGNGVDAPIAIQWDDWPAGACHVGDGAAVAVRSGSGEPEPGGGG
ncbi:MAG TPA: 2-amino-4-hydroxy-6-hydroxymethyldihydropteridine diphosphokinase [Terriglobia bacterium]|nr:2-amino-4-hydroxy-6-hydroxymethyldihydropteridine diphosphokinase [Terriglobia bacterium]